MMVVIGSPLLLFFLLEESLSTLTLQLLTDLLFHSNSFWQHQRFHFVLDAMKKEWLKLIWFNLFDKFIEIMFQSLLLVSISNENYLFTICTFKTIWRGVWRISSAIVCCRLFVDKRIFTLFDFSIMLSRNHIGCLYQN